MFELIVFLKAALLGLLVAAPPGPVAAMCLGRTLKNGRAQGFVLGLSVATADTLVAAVVALGLGAILEFVSREHNWLQFVGGIVVAFLGLQLTRAQPRTQEAGNLGASKALQLFLSGLLMTLSNPMTYGGFAAVIGAVGLAPKQASMSAALLVAGGVFAGSMLWWTTLVLCAGFFRRWLTDEHVRWIHRILGGALMAIGVLAVVLVGWTVLGGVRG